MIFVHFSHASEVTWLRTVAQLSPRKAFLKSLSIRLSITTMQFRLDLMFCSSVARPIMLISPTTTTYYTGHYERQRRLQLTTQVYWHYEWQREDGHSVPQDNHECLDCSPTCILSSMSAIVPRLPLTTGSMQRHQPNNVG